MAPVTCPAKTFSFHADDSVQLELHMGCSCANDFGEGKWSLGFGWPMVTSAYTQGYVCNFVDRGIAAVRRGRIVGVLTWNIDEGELESGGTFVSRTIRRRGLGLAMWELALSVERPGVVSMTVVSDRGVTLVQSLKRRHRGIYWDLSMDGARKLRVLGR